MSILIDYLTIPSTLLKSSYEFEHKYQLTEHKLSKYQMITVNNTFD